jgi:hypothetical protein
MSGVERERAYVAALYPGPKWKRKVLKMPNEQVLAIYFREKTKEGEAKAKAKQEKESSDDIPF